MTEHSFWVQKVKGFKSQLEHTVTIIVKIYGTSNPLLGNQTYKELELAVPMGSTLKVSHITRKRVFGDFRSGKIQTSLLSYRNLLETLDRASIHIILSKQRTIKMLIRLRGCAG